MIFIHKQKPLSYTLIKLMYLKIEVNKWLKIGHISDKKFLGIILTFIYFDLTNEKKQKGILNLSQKEEAMKRKERTKILVHCEKEFLQAWADRFDKEAPYQVLEKPSQSLTMVKMREKCAEIFYFIYVKC